MPALKVRVQKIIHHSNDFYILAVELDSGKSKSIKACGHICGLDELKPDSTIQLTGDFTTHPKYGSQFTFYGWKPWAPTPHSTYRFLQECVPGFFDPVATKKVVDTFGVETFRILCDEPETFMKLECEELDRDRLQNMLINWEALRSSYELSIFLQDNSISSHLIRAILAEFGPEARKIVNQNPYRLLSVPGFTFSRVDEIAERMGVPHTDIRRLEGAILWCLHNNASGGHLYVRRGDIPRALAELSSQSDIIPLSFNFDKDIPKAIANLAALKAVVIDPEVGLYLPAHYRFERDSAQLLAKFVAPMQLDADLKSFLEEYEKVHDISLSSQQRAAVEKLMQNKVLVLTGLPGTGKTTVIKTFVKLFQSTQINFALMAPTGIAAKRLSSVCGYPAATIHRALGYDGSNWGYSAGKKYPVGAVIVDEMSMVDMELFFRILDALDPGTILVFVGDDAQLPSVGPGSVLRELLNCSAMANVRLTEIFRQSHTSDIVLNSHKINRGESLDVAGSKPESEFQFVAAQDEDKVVDLISKMALKLKNRDANFQVLSPKYDGPVGVNNLNERLREILNPDKGQREQKFGELRLREGDRLMVVQNNYELNVYNGDMAKLLAIEEKDLLLKVHGGGLEGLDSLIRVPKKEAYVMLKLAYAITVHKCVDPDTLVETSQGLVYTRDLAPGGALATPLGQASYQGLVHNGTAPMLEIETTDGYRLRVTPSHGVDVWSAERGYERKEARSIAKKDFLCLRMTPEFDPIQSPSLPPSPSINVRAKTHRIPIEMDSNLAEFLGLMVADGTVYDRGFRLAKRHADVADRFDHLCRALFQVEPTRFFTNNAYHVEVSSTQLVSWLRAIGGMNPNDKMVPSLILNSSLTIQAGFLRGFFEDGTVSIRKRDGYLDHISVFSCFDSIVRAVKTMLLRFGIITGIARKSRGVDICVYGFNSVKFRDRIGLIAAFKRNRLQLPVGEETKYLVPVLRSEVDEITSVNGGRSALTHSDKNAFSRGTMSRHHLAQFLERMKERPPAWYALYNRLSFHHSRVRSISTYMGESVCIEVPDGNRFIQDGFCGWNSQGSEFETVILPIFRSQGRMLQRNLLYTAVTRAKKKVWLLGDPIAVDRAIANDKVVQRNTALEKSIVAAIKAGVTPPYVGEPPRAVESGVASEAGKAPDGA